MKGNFLTSLALVLHHEGGWSDHAADPGGATMQGITLATYSSWLGRQATKAELRAIPYDHVHTIYRTRYWDTVRGDDLPAGADLAVFDMSVNSGPPRAARMLQRAVGAKPDGVIGPQTLALARAWNPAELIDQYHTDRQRFLNRLSNNGTFGKGWTRRVDETREACLRLAACGV